MRARRSARHMQNALLEPEEMGKNVQCLGDLQGPKFRVGELAGARGRAGGSQGFRP